MTDDGGATVRGVVRLVRDAEITFLAAAIAYYAFVSLLPALLIVIAVATALGGDAIADRVVRASANFLTPTAQGVLADAITASAGRSGATIVGVLLLLWSALRVFRGLDIAFSRVYDTGGEESIFGQIRDGLIVFLAVGLAIGGMFGVGAVLAAVPLPIGSDLLGFVGLLVGLGVVFLPLYLVFPDADVSITEAAPGTVLAASTWVILQGLFQSYAAAAPRYELYGVIGGVLLLVTWFYFAAVALLSGAVLNAVLARSNRQGQGPAGRPS